MSCKIIMWSPILTQIGHRAKKKWIPALDESCLLVANDQKGLFSSP